MAKIKLKPNGCSFFIEGKHTSCCNQHDIDYILGINRKLADKKLLECIKKLRYEQYLNNISNEKNPYKIICYAIKIIFWFNLAHIIYYFVRIFGWYFWYRAKFYRENDYQGKHWLYNKILNNLKGDK